MVNSPLDTRFFNIDVLVVRDEQVRGLGEVTKPNILEANSSRFEKDGLFSTDIFGPVGSDIRKVALGYIDLKVDTMHPHVWYNLLTLNSKYEDIIAGKVKAKYDIEKGDLVEDKVNGQTGYTYFLSVLPRIKFNDNGSDERRAKIAYVKKYCKQEYFSNKLLVLPAGLRDYRVDSSGKPMEDEVNTLYRRVLAITTLLKSVKVSDKNTEQLDPIRYKLQKSIGAIYEHFFGLIHGKEKFIQSKWSKRAIVNGTRNVLTPVPYKITNLNNNKITTNHTVCGLYQFIKAISPVTMNRVKTLFINKFISPNSDTAMLVDGGTMRTTLARISVAKRDEWLSMEGLTKVMNKLKQPDLRFEPVVIDNHYLQLIYDNGRDIILINNTDDITPNMKSEFIRPITYIEMFYIAIYDVKDKYPGFVTRYPVANLGGIYPCYIYVKTTFKSRTVNVTMDGRKIEMEEYPILGEDCMESVSASAQHIKGLSGDYDGDTVSLNVVYTEESIQEIKQLLSSAKYYLTPEGTMAYSANDDVIDLVLSHMTDEPSKINISKEDNLAKEFPKDASIQAKFTDDSLVRILSILRYLGIRSKIPVEDLHVTLFHSDKSFVYSKPDSCNYEAEIDKLVNVGNNVAIKLKSMDLSNRSLTLSNGEESSVPLHVDIIYNTRYSQDVLDELNVKLEAYKKHCLINLNLNQEVLVDKSEK